MYSREDGLINEFKKKKKKKKKKVPIPGVVLVVSPTVDGMRCCISIGCSWLPKLPSHIFTIIMCFRSMTVAGPGPGPVF